MQQGHEVGHYAAQALLYYKEGMTTSPIEVDTLKSPPDGAVKIMSCSATLGSARHERSRVVCA